MRVRTKSKSGLFLIELILAILFFSIASAVCIQIFVTANLLSEKSSNSSMAVTISESAAEALKGTNGNADEMAQLLGAFVSYGDDGAQLLTVNYDENWIRLPAVPSTKTVYSMNIILQTQAANWGEFVNGEIQVVRAKQTGDVIYNLSVKKFLNKNETGGK